MGQWGPESSSSDSCYDLVSMFTEVNHPEQDKLEDALLMASAAVLEPGANSYSKQDFVGIVMIGLRSGLIIPFRYLQMAMNFLDSLADDFIYQDTWKNWIDRAHAIAMEKEEIKASLLHGGAGVKKTVPSLMERMREAVNGD